MVAARLSCLRGHTEPCPWLRRETSCCLPALVPRQVPVCPCDDDTQKKTGRGISQGHGGWRGCTSTGRASLGPLDRWLMGCVCIHWCNGQPLSRSQPIARVPGHQGPVVTLRLRNPAQSWELGTEASDRWLHCQASVLAIFQLPPLTATQTSRTVQVVSLPHPHWVCCSCHTTLPGAPGTASVTGLRSPARPLLHGCFTFQNSFKA